MSSLCLNSVLLVTSLLFLFPLPVSAQTKQHGLSVIDFKGETVKDLKPFKVRHFPNASRVVFKVPKIPGIKEDDVANLFDIKLPALTIGHSSELQYLITHSTLTRWDGIYYAAPVPDEHFPMNIEEGTTPAQLLEKFIKLSGKPVHYDEKTHTLFTPKDPYNSRIIPSVFRGLTHSPQGNAMLAQSSTSRRDER